MPLHYQRDDVHRRVVLTGERQVTAKEWVDCLAQQVEDGAWHYATLYDFTAPHSALPGPDEAAKLTTTALQLQEEVGIRGPLAFAVGDYPEYHGVRGWVDTVGTRLPYKVQAFRTRQDAERWLEAVEPGHSRQKL